MKLRSALIKLHSRLLGKCSFVSDRSFVRGAYFLSFGKFPDLEHPKSFNEHICAIKCASESLKLAPYVDKYAVRDYVARQVGETYLNPILGVYDKPEDIPYGELPKRFVLKCTHGSGYNIIVTDKAKLNIAKTNRQLRKWLRKNYYHVGRERNYKNVRPRIMADSYISHGEALQEYKIFCFGGVPRLVDVNVFSEKGRTTGIYTTDWERVPVKFGYAPTPELTPKPRNLSELLNVAAELARPFPFVRVDLYHDGENTIFSELTFTSGGGLVHFEPEDYDSIFGGYFEDKV